MTRNMAPFVSTALKACELMEICDKAGQGIVMRFSKMYEPQKIVNIVNHAKKFPWWKKNPKAAFMKAVGEINRMEKDKEKSELKADLKKNNYYGQ